MPNALDRPVTRGDVITFLHVLGTALVTEHETQTLASPLIRGARLLTDASRELLRRWKDE